MAESGDKPGGFKVTDRRSFDGSGERKQDEPATQDPQPATGPDKVEPSQSATAAPAKTESPRSLPPADFATLVLSLGSSAIMYLGESDEAAGGGKTVERNLPMAKHAIDLLTVLEDKTKGNLSAEEQHILESLLFDLRLRYVEELKASPAGT